LVFVDTSENSIIADDVATPSNLPIAPVEEEEFEKTPVDVNVSQEPCKKKSFRKVVCT
jgi:hypothetical protein